MGAKKMAVAHAYRNTVGFIISTWLESSQPILAKFRITILYHPGLGMFVNILMNLQVRLV
jgi:hypothetical protein